MGIFYISMVKAENSCEACAGLKFPQKTEYRNEALEQIKMALLEVEEAGEISALSEKECEALTGDYNALVQACRECNGHDMVIQRWTRQMVVLVDVPLEEEIANPEKIMLENSKRAALN